MLNLFKNLLLTTLALFCLSGVVFSNATADDLNKGFVELTEGRPAGAVKLWLPLAEGGDRIAQASLALLYQTGQGVTRDYKKANELLLASAMQGYPFAFTGLGKSFHDGLGVNKDMKIAMVWFLLAMDYDPNAKAMANMIGAELPKSALRDVQRKVNECQSSLYQDCSYDLIK